MNDTMMIRNPETNEWESVYLPPTGDTLPVGSIVDYDGDIVPTNYEEVEDPNQYSTDEVETEKTWIDGKPIYRKVIDFGALPNAGFKNVAHNIEGLDSVICLRGIAKTTTNNFYPIPFVGNGSMFNNATATMRINATEVTIATTTDVSSHTAYVILEYTKSGDTLKEVQNEN